MDDLPEHELELEKLAERRREFLESWWRDRATADMKEHLLCLEEYQNLSEDVVRSLSEAGAGAMWVKLTRGPGDIRLRALSPLEDFLAEKRGKGNEAP